MSADELNVSIAVPVQPLEAFRLFTQEIDLWWRRGPVYRTGKNNSLRLEPELGGRFLDVDASSGLAREIGRVQVWEPGERLQLEWRASNFQAGEVTYIEVRFTSEQSGTRVAVRHFGWDALPADHPVRHDQQGAAFVRFQSRWWADLLTALQRYAGQAANEK